MKALTVKQPWASFLAYGYKLVETRSWATKYRGPVLIHAGLGHLTSAGLGYFTDACITFNLPLKAATLPFGHILAVATLKDCIPYSDFVGCHLDTRQERYLGFYGPGRFMWVLEGAHLFDKPIKAVGRLGLWNIGLQDDQFSREDASHLRKLILETK